MSKIVPLSAVLRVVGAEILEASYKCQIGE